MNWIYWIWLIAIQAVWSASYLAMKLSSREFSNGGVVLARYGIATGCFLLFWFFRGFPRFSRRHTFRILILGALNFCLAPFMQVKGLSMTQAIDASIMIAFEPLITVLVATLLLKERPDRFTWIALVVSSVGLVLLSTAGQDSIHDTFPHRVAGNLIFLLSLCFEASVTVSGKPLTRVYSPVDSIGALMAAGFLFSIFFYAPTSGIEIFQAHQATTWGAILFLSLGCSVFAYTAWYRVISRIPVHWVALSLFLQPVFGSILGFYFLNERLEMSSLIGAVLICVTLVFWQWKEAHLTPDREIN